MLLLEVVILAIIQGVAEFLPISSSGHVVVGAAVFDSLGSHLHEMITVNVVLHLGTLAAIVVFYRRQIWELTVKDHRGIALLVLATLPAIIVGPPLEVFGGRALKSPLLTGWMFLVTGGLLVWTLRLKPGRIAWRDLGYGWALLIGVFQAVAVLPGISRSGATIVAGLACGMKREDAATFSFLLAIPVIAGAAVFKLAGSLRGPSESAQVELLGLGAAISFAVGLVSLAWLIRWLRKGHLHYFAWWVFPLGIAVIVWKLRCP
jgi:undecaprenyl-diphosphatase